MPRHSSFTGLPHRSTSWKPSGRSRSSVAVVEVGSCAPAQSARARPHCSRSRRVSSRLSVDTRCMSPCDEMSNTNGSCRTTASSFSRCASERGCSACARLSLSRRALRCRSCCVFTFGHRSGNRRLYPRPRVRAMASERRLPSGSWWAWTSRESSTSWARIQPASATSTPNPASINSRTTRSTSLWLGLSAPGAARHGPGPACYASSTRWI